MSLSLFDEIHDSYCCYERTTPATVDEFIAFGLQAEDYSHYVALQQKFQSELAMYGHPKEDSISTHDKQQKTTYPTLNKFITFLKEKHLIEIDNHYDNSHYFSKLLHCDRFDAEYRHEWLCFPMEAEQFRLIIERKLSKWWNKEAAYLAKTFGAISFIYDDHDSHHMAEFDSPLRIRKYNPQTNDFVILKHNEVEKIFKRIQQEKKTIEKHEWRFSENNQTKNS